MNRSTIVQAAATSVCETANLVFSRPLFEQINKSNEHWLRRQIGGVVEKGARADWKDWRDETVKCTTGQKLVADWSDRYYYKAIASTATKVGTLYLDPYLGPYLSPYLSPYRGPYLGHIEAPT